MNARPQRTKVDWALEMEELLRTRYTNAQKVVLVCDNLNTHTPGAFYEAFDAQYARELARRIENIEMLRTETSAWADSSNKKRRGVDWQFTIEKARIKLKSLYPRL